MGSSSTRLIAAKVVDPTHLELTEPLELQTGSQVAVAVTEDTGPALPPAEPGSAPQTLLFRHRENEWCRTHGEALDAYADQWVVLEGEEIIAHGDDPTELVKHARDRGIRSPYVFYVERREPGVVKIGL